MKLITITLSSAPATTQNYNYKVEIQATDNSNNWNTVHYGKFFAMAGQTTVTLDLDDILYDQRFTASQTLAPVLNVTHNQWEMPVLSTTWNNITDYWYNAVKVSSLDETPAFTTITKSFGFTPANELFGNSIATYGTSYNPVAGEPIPHIPSNAPTGFHWGLNVYVSASTLLGIKKDTDQNYVTTTVTKPQAVKLTPAANTKSFSLGIGSTYTTATIVDQCNKPYYLVWMNNTGGLQCQGFLRTTDFSINYETKKRTDMHNSQWKVNSLATGKWKMKSQNLTDAEFEAYGEIFNSPYVVLLDMVNNRLHYVTVSDTDYKEKKRTRTDTKPIFFEIEVESSDRLRV